MQTFFLDGILLMFCISRVSQQDTSDIGGVDGVMLVTGR